MKKPWYTKWWSWLFILVLVIVALMGAFYEKTNTRKVASPIKVNQHAATKHKVDKKANTNKTNTAQQPSKDLPNIDTTKSPFEKGYYDYQGTIGKDLSIQLSIYPLGKEIVGSYFYENKRIEIELKGKAGANEIILNEYDEAGKNTGTFKGTMDTVDKIDGTWISADNKRSYPFTLSCKSIAPGAEYGKRYGVATTESDQNVENFVSEIQSDVIHDRKEQLAEVVVYPIHVKMNGKETTLQNQDDFIKNYDKVFYPNFKQILSHAFTKYMFANWRGIMFGTDLNNIWINEVILKNGTSKLMIASINNGS